MRIDFPQRLDAIEAFFIFIPMFESKHCVFLNNKEGRTIGQCRDGLINLHFGSSMVFFHGMSNTKRI
jgi:hypothetical protein